MSRARHLIKFHTAFFFLVQNVYNANCNSTCNTIYIADGLLCIYISISKTRSMKTSHLTHRSITSKFLYWTINSSFSTFLMVQNKLIVGFLILAVWQIHFYKNVKSIQNIRFYASFLTNLYKLILYSQQYLLNQNFFNVQSTFRLTPVFTRFLPKYRVCSKNFHRSCYT